MIFSRTSMIIVVAIISRTTLLFLPMLFGYAYLNIPRMMGKLYGGGDFLGWLLFLSSLTVLSLVYLGLYMHWAPSKNMLVNGIVFGIFVFALSSVNLLFFRISGVMEQSLKDNFVLFTSCNIISCSAFGMVLSLLHKE